MAGIEVSPDALRSASGTLGAVRGELSANGVGGGGGTGQGPLDGALDTLSERLQFVAQAMGEAVEGTSGDLRAGAESYEGTDETQFRGGGR